MNEEKESDLTKLLSLRHIKRLVLEQAEKAFILPRDYGIGVELADAELPSMIRYLLDNGTLTRIELGKCAVVDDGEYSYFLKLKNE